MAKVRVNIILDDTVYAMINDYAAKHGINRSAAISLLCTQGIEQSQVASCLPQLMEYAQENGLLVPKP